MASVRLARPVRASSWSAFGRNQSAWPSSGASRSRSWGRPGCSTSTATSASVASRGPGYLRQFLAGQPGQRVRGADEQGPAVRDVLQVDVGAAEQPRRAGDVQRGALPVRPYRQDGGRGLDTFFPNEAGGFHAVPGHRGGDDVAQQVVAERADDPHAGAQLGQVDGGPGGGARGGGPDLGEPGAALAGRDRLDRPAQHVQDAGTHDRYLSPGVHEASLAGPRLAGRRGARRNGGGGTRR